MPGLRSAGHRSVGIDLEPRRNANAGAFIRSPEEYAMLPGGPVRVVESGRIRSGTCDYGGVVLEP